MQKQMAASAAREERLTALLEKALDGSPASPSPLPSTSPSPSTPASAKTVSVERPVLMVSATMADFVAWEEAWEDYSRCQHLNQQDLATRRSALRQALDEDLRRFIREGIISVTDQDDTPAVISELRRYIRRQRNPLLDRLAFYGRKQQQGESFDSFFSSLHELYKASDFESPLCQSCKERVCNDCSRTTLSSSLDMLRDRVVCGVLDDAVRHKLLAEPALTLEKAAKICRAEEAAQQTGDSLPTTGAVNAARRQSAYKRRQTATPKPSKETSSGPRSEASTSDKSKAKCSACGRSHNKQPCPALTWKCGKCHQKGHFGHMCPNPPAQPKRTANLAHLSLSRASNSNSSAFVSVDTQLEHVVAPRTLRWLPDTGSDVDAIGLCHLSALGGNIVDLTRDPDTVYTADGRSLTSLGRIRATLFTTTTRHTTTVHVYDGLTDALLSRTSLAALGYLPEGWPQHIRRTTSDRDPPPAEVERVHAELLEEFSDVFNEDGELPPMNGAPMDILLTPDAKPHCVNGARPIPFAYRAQIKDQLDDMLAHGIIEAVVEPTEWCHPVVIVNKKNSEEKRLTVDLRKLNDQVRRPTHPMTTPRAALSAIGSGAKFFTTLDARHGYWQIPLSADAKPLTTFITPWGRYRFCRNPQGLISAGDEFNRRTDAAFANIGNLTKVVDDCLVHDSTFPDHVAHVRSVLECARKHGITFSAKKFIFGAHTVPFCGYTVSADGWTLDACKTTAIRDFPVPQNRTDLHSFFGLVNQCSAFLESLSELCLPLRPLLKTSMEFTWDSSHTAAFNAVKAALISPPILAHFELGRPLRLETDASVLHGLGYALWQQQRDDRWHLIECGSRFLSDAESRYAVIELECLAVVWAVKKCGLFLHGSLFDVVTDHRPLVPILNRYTLDQIENPRLQRLILKLRPYQLQATWRKGTDNAFADALSRYPVQQPSPDDELGQDPSVSGLSIRACLRDDSSNLRMHTLQEAALADPDYQLLRQTVLNGFPACKTALPHPLRPYWNGREHLLVDNGLVLRGERLVIPRSLRRSVLRDLHAAHQGLTRTKQRARQTVFWPYLNNDLETLIRSCPQCRLHASSQPKEPLLVEDRAPSFPFQSVSADLFSCQGHQYLAYADRLTGWPCLSDLGRSADSAAVIRVLRRWFADLGIPETLTTDNGPHFSSHRFAEFCTNWQIRHVTSSPHYPQSNGHAEAAVKAMKTLVLKTTSNGNLDVDSFQRGLLEWRNTPGRSGRSPAQMLFGRPLDSFVLARRSEFSTDWHDRFTALDRGRDSDAVTIQYNRTAHPLPRLQPGTHVDLQDPSTKLWQQHGVIVSAGRHRDYQVRLPSGRVLRRNRRFLRPRVMPAPVPTSAPAPAPTPPTTAAPATSAQPRRSTRRRRKPKRLDISTTRGQSYV